MESQGKWWITWMFDGKTLKWFAILSLLLFVISCYFVIFYFPVHVDSAYYISTARLIARGYTPIKEVQMVYPPLVFYILSIPYHIIKSPSYEVMVCWSLIIKMAGTYCLFKIISPWLKVKYLALFISFSFLISTVLFEGQAPLLESYVIFFQLFSLFMVLKKEIKWQDVFFAGIGVGCSFLCKQYGLFILPALGVSFLLYKVTLQKKIILLFLLLMGLLTPILLLGSYFFFYGVSMKELYDSVFNGGYGNKSIGSLIIGIKLVLARNGLYLLLVPFLLIKYRGLIKERKFIILALALAGSMSPFFFKYNGHYLLLVVPYLYLLGVFIIKYLYDNSLVYSSVYSVIILYGIYYCFFLTIIKDVRENIVLSTDVLKKEQYYIASQLSSLIEPNNSVASYSSTIWPYLCDFDPVDLKRGAYLYPGYSCLGDYTFFTNTVSPEVFIDNLQNVNYLIFTESDSKYLVENGILGRYEKRKIINEVQVWQRKK